MLMKKTLFISLLLFGLLASACTVQLGPKETENAQEETSSEEASASVSGEFVNYLVSYDDDVWTVEEGGDTDEYEYLFSNKDESIFAMLIAERMELTYENLKTAALENFESVSDDVEVLDEKTVKVNGFDMHSMRTRVEMDGMTAVYEGYYYVGDEGSIQFVAYSLEEDAEASLDDIEALLSGLKVGEGEASSVSRDEEAGELQTVEGPLLPYEISYDDGKWVMELPESSEDQYDFFFSHRDGDVYGMVITDTAAMTRDELKEAALANFSSVGEPSVVSEEEVEINGVKMIEMKTAVDLEGTPFFYHGYYYTGDDGAIQFVFYSSQNLIEAYEEDVLELLNSLSI